MRSDLISPHVTQAGWRFLRQQNHNYSARDYSNDYLSWHPTSYLFIYLFCHIYPGVPHQCAALFSLGLLHYMHDKTNINQHTFSYNTVTTLTTWYISLHHYMHNVNYVHVPHYSGYMPVQVHVWSTLCTVYLINVTFNIH